MRALRGTLVADGSSDRVLIPVIEWALREHRAFGSVTWANLSVLPQPPKTLADRARAAIELHPCDLLFVHRDAERVSRAERKQEIEAALKGHGRPYLCVIPVRMTEAWLLVNAEAIAEAAGNPAGAQSLRLPSLKKLESLPDPKETLHGLLREACGLDERRTRRFRVQQAVHRVAALTTDFRLLKSLGAYSAFHEELAAVLKQLAAES